MKQEDFLNQIIDDFQYMYWAMVRRKPAGETLPFAQKAALLMISWQAPLNIKQLSDAMHVTSGAATQVVDALVEAQLVERISDASDRRTVVVMLTKNGKKAVQHITRVRLSILSDLFKDVNEADIATFLRVMKKIRQNADKFEEGDMHGSK